MTNIEASVHVKEYLQKSRMLLDKDLNPVPLDDCYVHPELQYLIIDAKGRIEDAFGEVTKRDLVLLAEAWIMAQGTKNPRERPLLRR